VTAFCVAYVAVQIVLSIRGLSNPGRLRFAWGMYAVAGSLPTIDIVYPAAYARPMEPDVAERFLVMRGRPDVDYEVLLPPYICAAVPAAEALHVERRTFPCRR